jgi:hypothetical protein
VKDEQATCDFWPFDKKGKQKSKQQFYSFHKRHYNFALLELQCQWQHGLGGDAKVPLYYEQD